MSRYNYGMAPHASATKSSSGLSTGLKSERHDERASQSGSEDGSYALYSDTHKMEADLDEDHALTSQTLNADGTPKRPMNAFMIFARRRRPQVSAENQAMRTGEISKILSKEWVSMPPSEKQFYLEQAKQLKETFNTKYPDYVYRRRPNNSRKRRRSDGAIRPADNPLLGDADDLLDPDGSPTDGDEQLEPPSSYPRGQDVGFVGHSKYDVGQSRASIHSYPPSDPHFRSNAHHDSRNMPYPSPTDRLHSTLGSNPSPRLPHISGSLNYAYVPSPSHLQSPPGFGHDSIDTQQGWQPRLERLSTGWTGNTHDRIAGPPTTQKQNSYSASASNSWSSSPDSAASATAPSASSSNYFPTLNTPFYPNQSNVPSFQSNHSAPPSHSVSPLSPSSSQFDSLGLQPTGMSRDFTPRSYTSSSIGPNNSFPPASGRDTLPYPQRSLPSVHSVTGFSSSSTSGPQTQGYWSRE